MIVNPVRYRPDEDRLQAGRVRPSRKDWAMNCPVCHGAAIKRLPSGDVDACPACAKAAEAEYQALRGTGYRETVA